MKRLLADLREGRLTNGIVPRAFVLLLQEAREEPAPEGLFTFFAPARTVRGVGRGNAIVSTLPLVDARTFELPRERQRRLAAIASIRVEDQDLLLVNVHLENRASWWKGGLPGDRARARQMDALLAQLPPTPGVLGGDLNIWLGTRERAYQDARARFPHDSGPPAITFRDRLALDHLLFRLPAEWTATSRAALSRYGSDHYPVIAVLRATGDNRGRGGNGLTQRNGATEANGSLRSREVFLRRRHADNGLSERGSSIRRAAEGGSRETRRPPARRH